MSAKRKTFHQEFAEQIIDDLKKGTAPWQKPWKAGEFHPPFNPISGTVYSGVNFVSLAREGMEDPRFVTFNQANAEGLRIKKGSKSRPVVFWQFTKEENVLDDDGKPILDEEGKQQKETFLLERPILRFASVFHATQVEGMPEWKGQDVSWNPHERSEAILEGSGASISHDQRDRAFFSYTLDKIKLPPKDKFDSQDKYYATALHELGHWTGHEKRWKGSERTFGPKGTQEYAREELNAEIASWMVSMEVGLEYDRGRHLAYVDSWIQALEKDPYEIMRACQTAERIKGHMLGFEKGIKMEDQKEKNITKEKVKEQEPEQTLSQLAKEKTYLAVPYSQKNTAKKLGAKWDGRKKSWYAPEGSDLTSLSQWLPDGKQKEEKPQMAPEQEFAQALREAGLIVEGLPIMNGELQRVRVEGGKQNKKDGAYTGYLDGRPAGFIENHKTGLRTNWKANGHKLSPEAMAKIKANAAMRQEARDLERREAQEQAAKRAYAKWRNAKGWAPEDQPYLKKKGVKSHGTKIDMHGNLLIPGRDSSGRIQTMQTITPEGKLFESGAKKQGAFHLISHYSGTNPKQPLLIAEGYATAASIHEATHKPVAVAFDAGNLEPVAKELKKAFPDAPFVFVADDDHTQKKNPGISKARAAAKSVGGVVVKPKLTEAEKAKGLTDFNDIHQERGLNALKVELNAGIRKALSKTQSQELIPQ
ncbi:zincin-like metallopeptidase domain-containing protein [Halodesulfovibrio marinisediminis]|uniref:Antirestriction protein ArdC n=1 Tax=Halodesulfovibrio marinisediminis DSM 17456 TaxID=1121457 RepID=A0A1N6JAR4_9BACT|nr:zincin-like metallopeptidase domain-containing protein [Halodesulfovibrio marinisediminis]SIO41355.1 Antirestriction protein ArdC [Halodesulfovibrio marinisediminis DSM 17456]